MEKWRGDLRKDGTKEVGADSTELWFWWYLTGPPSPVWCLHKSWCLRAHELSMAELKH